MDNQTIKDFLNIRKIENTITRKNITFIIRGTLYSIVLQPEGKLTLNRSHTIDFKTIIIVEENNQLIFIDEYNKSVYSINTELSSIKVYTVQEVAFLLKLTPRTIQGYVLHNDIHGFKINGQHWRVTEEELRAYISRSNNTREIT
jgi:excisionase family DNA binding protein